jgi:hypothetical protein
VAGVVGVFVVAEIAMNPYASPNAADSLPSTAHSSWARVSTWCGVVAAIIIWLISLLLFGFSLWEQRDESATRFMLEHPWALMCAGAAILLRMGLIPVAIVCCLPERRSSRAAQVGLYLAIAGAILVVMEEVWDIFMRFMLL